MALKEKHSHHCRLVRSQLEEPCNKAEVSFSLKRGYSSDRGKELSMGTGKCGAGKSRGAAR